MVNIEILDAKPEHVRELSKKLHDVDIRTAEKLGLKPHVALWRSYKRSLYSRAMIADGEIMGMWGIAGTYLGAIGYPWLITSTIAEEFPVRAAFRYRKELKEMLKLFPLLVEMADIEHEKSLRMLSLMGFKFCGTEPRGKNGELFVRAEMRN